MDRLNRKLNRKYHGKVQAEKQPDCIRVTGESADWDEIIAACSLCVQRRRHGRSRRFVVNDIRFSGAEECAPRLPHREDLDLDQHCPDVLIIGGGIIGCSIARELTKWDLDVLLVEKEADLAVQASGRNDGEVHPGVDLPKGSQKQRYVLQGNRMYEKVCRELAVPFRRCGQYVGFDSLWLWPYVALFALQRRWICGVPGTCLVGRKKLRAAEPELNPAFKFALYNPTAACVSPYELTIAYGENAVANGATIALQTVVLGMETAEGRILSVLTNRGRIYPTLVINAAGVFAEEIARMAGDRFYSIHPRRGTDVILDKKAKHLIRSIASIKRPEKNSGHTKGGGIMRTTDNNILIGPNAVETWEKENYATDRASLVQVLSKQKQTAPGLREQDIITYFTGVRAATFEEDFVIEPGRRVKNIFHCAGMQSPGLTAAPAVALDVSRWAATELGKMRNVRKRPEFNPKRQGIPRLRELSREERDRLIHAKPDYGVIICRCEEISKGEIIDALDSPLSVPTVDGVKKRLRAGMGRCQGGFCLPLVMQIISEHEGIALSEIRKAEEEAVISFGPTKG